METALAVLGVLALLVLTAFLAGSRLIVDSISDEDKEVIGIASEKPA